jgi:hypothetical protein
MRAQRVHKLFCNRTRFALQTEGLSGNKLNNFRGRYGLAILGAGLGKLKMLASGNVVGHPDNASKVVYPSSSRMVPICYFRVFLTR